MSAKPAQKAGVLLDQAHQGVTFILDDRRRVVDRPLSLHTFSGCIVRVHAAVRLQEGVSMLVLSRKKNESIIINDNITVTVVEIRGDKVRLGIDAPKEVSVHRREVYEAIQNHKLPKTPLGTPEPGLS
jgi:carbon storage regulator